MSDELGFNSQPQQPSYQQPAYGGQPQYGYSQQQTGYTPPAGGYTPPPPMGYSNAPSGRTGRGGGWIMLLRVFLWLWFTAICLAGLFICMGAFQEGSRWDEPSLMLAGVGALIGCVFLAFVCVAGGMVALDVAQNIRRCAINSSNILNLLNQQQNKQ